MKLKKLSAGFSAAVLGFSSLLTIAITPMVSAAADTCTWTGAGDGVHFTDGANWTGCDNAGVPENVDTLTFPELSGNPSVTLVNDLGYEVAGINLTSASGGSTNYNVDTLSLANGATINDQGESGSGYANLNITSVTALGDLTLTGGGSRVQVTTWSITGVVTIGDGEGFDGSDVSSNGVIVQNGGTLYFGSPASATPTTPTYPITLGGGAGISRPSIVFYAYSSGSGSQNTTWAFANPITLLGNAYIMLAEPQVTVNQTGTIDGAGFALAMDPASATGSKLTLAASSNNSATVLGTFTGSGSGITGGQGGGVTPTTTAPKTPDTGFALVTANPTLTLGVVTVTALAIAYGGRRLQLASAKTSRR